MALRRGIGASDGDRSRRVGRSSGLVSPKIVGNSDPAALARSVYLDPAPVTITLTAGAPSVNHLATAGPIVQTHALAAGPSHLLLLSSGGDIAVSDAPTEDVPSEVRGSGRRRGPPDDPLVDAVLEKWAAIEAARAADAQASLPTGGAKQSRALVAAVTTVEAPAVQAVAARSIPARSVDGAAGSLADPRTEAAIAAQRRSSSLRALVLALAEMD